MNMYKSAGSQSKMDMVHKWNKKNLLVIHYSRQSLVDHNELLTTIMETPVGTVLSQQESVVYVPMNQK